jgi:hypothetical protein
MTVSPKDTKKGRRMVQASPGTAIADASWWLPMPSGMSGVASIGGVFGLIPVDVRRFDPAADNVLLRRDASRLMFVFSRARKRAEDELRQEENAAQQRLFDPDSA